MFNDIIRCSSLVLFYCNKHCYLRKLKEDSIRNTNAKTPTAPTTISSIITHSARGITSISKCQVSEMFVLTLIRGTLKITFTYIHINILSYVLFRLFYIPKYAVWVKWVQVKMDPLKTLKVALLHVNKIVEDKVRLNIFSYSRTSITFKQVYLLSECLFVDNNIYTRPSFIERIN